MIRITVILLLISSFAYAQEVNKFVATDLSVKVGEDDFTEWRKLRGVLIFTKIIDDGVSTIDVYAAEYAQFSVVKFGEQYKTDRGSAIDFYCVDNDGIKCSVTFMIVGEESYCIISYTDLIVMYRITRP